MPIYEYKCTSCNHISEFVRGIGERKDGPPCEKCGQDTSLKMSVNCNPNISGYPYFDPIFDRSVESPSHRRQLIRANGLEEKG